MDPIRVAILGYGLAGRTFHAPVIRAVDGLALVAVASSDPAKVHADLGADVAVQPWPELVARDDIHLVVIATPNELHHPQSIAALRAGRHVVVDKPFALDAAQAREMIGAARAAGRMLSVFHNRRWDGDFLTLAMLLREGRVGRAVEFQSNFDRFRPLVRQRWREGPGPGAGLWIDLGPHLLDQAVRLFGTPSAIALDVAALRDGARADDWFDARLVWRDGPHAGLRARLHASTLAAEPGPRFVLHGTRGSCRIEGIDPQEEALKAGKPARGAGWGLDARTAQLATGDDARVARESVPLLAGDYPAFYGALRDALRGQAPGPVDPLEALQVQALIDTGRASANERRELAFVPAGAG